MEFPCTRHHKLYTSWLLFRFLSTDTMHRSLQWLRWHKITWANKTLEIRLWGGFRVDRTWREKFRVALNAISTKRKHCIATPPGWDASPSQGYPQHYVIITHLYTWVKRDNLEQNLIFLSTETQQCRDQTSLNWLALRSSNRPKL